jgi:hypothetical protein
MMIQVMAVEDIRGLLGGRRFMSAGAIYGVAGTEGSGRSRRPVFWGTRYRIDRCLHRGRSDASPMSPR